MIRPILSTDDYDNKIKSTGHHTILKFQDKYYIVYHRFNTLDSYPISQKLSQVVADELLFNSNGSIKRVVTTHRGVPGLQKVPTRINIAFERKGTNSDDLDSTITKAKYAVDENNSTLWIGGKYAEEWLQLDLGSIKSFKEIQVFPEFPTKAYQYKVELSDDQKTWKLADDKCENTKIGSPMVTDKNMKARFIRITLRNNQDNPRAGIWEVKVF